jgi:hypothetical protein
MRKSKLSTIAISVLQQEILRRQKMLPNLIAQRDALNREIAELQGLAEPQAQRQAKPQAAPKKARRRLPKNKISLADALAQFAKGKAKVTIAQATEGVLSAGYKSKSKEFRAVVNQRLHDDKRFKSVGRGEFALKA